MLETIAIAFRNQATFKAYMLVTMAVMLAPLVLAPIYHWLINRSAGGRRLIRANERHKPLGRSPGAAMRHLPGAAKMARDIAAGRYGQDVRRLQNRTYLLMGLWAIVSLGMMMLPILAMSTYPDPARQPGLQATPPAR